MVGPVAHTMRWRPASGEGCAHSAWPGSRSGSRRGAASNAGDARSTHAKIRRPGNAKGGPESGSPRWSFPRIPRARTAKNRHLPQPTVRRVQQ
jgi:hypothetical protein